MSAQQVGVPSTKRRIFVAGDRNNPSAEECLTRWKARLTSMRVQPVTLKTLVGSEGSYFLNRNQGEQSIVLFEYLILSLTRGHIFGETPPPSGHEPHPSDEGLLEGAQELHLLGFAKITTGFEGYIFALALERSVITTILVDSTPGGIVRAVVNSLRATGILPKAPTQFHRTWNRKACHAKPSTTSATWIGGQTKLRYREKPRTLQRNSASTRS